MERSSQRSNRNPIGPVRTQGLQQQVPGRKGFQGCMNRLMTVHGVHPAVKSPGEESILRNGLNTQRLNRNVQWLGKCRQLLKYSTTSSLMNFDKETHSAENIL